MFESLMGDSIDEPSTSYGLIAEWASYPADYSSVTFHLRKEAHWHDGTPITPEDVPFLAGVYASTRWDELAPTGWSDEEKAVFCRRQFDAQSAHYRENYPGALLQIIERARPLLTR